MAELDRNDADRREAAQEGDWDDEEQLAADAVGEVEQGDDEEAGDDVATAPFIRTPPPPEVLALGRRIVDVLTDHQAADVILLDISPMASFADYFVIATGNSDRHLIALREAVDDALDDDGLQPIQVEGEPATGWVLMDYGDVIVHLFDSRTRDYYRLERIWDRAATVVRVL